MKFIKKIPDNETYLQAFIGYKIIQNLNLDDSETTSIRVGINLYFLLIKIEFIPIYREKKDYKRIRN